MAVVCSKDAPSKNSPARLFQAGCMDIHKIVPLVLPQVFSSACILEGNGDVGTVKLFNFVEGSPFKFVKERVEALDKEKYECVYSVEGGPVGTVFTAIIYRLKLVPAGDGGCVFSFTGEYTVTPGVDAEVYIKGDIEQNVGIFLAVDAYLSANPGAYA